MGSHNQHVSSFIITQSLLIHIKSLIGLRSSLRNHAIQTTPLESGICASRSLDSVAARVVLGARAIRSISSSFLRRVSTIFAEYEVVVVSRRFFLGWQVGYLCGGFAVFIGLDDFLGMFSSVRTEVLVLALF